MQLSSRKLTGTWILLVALTLVSAGLGSLGLSQELLVFLVLLTVLIKNHQIIDVFMELKSAPLLWRGLMQLFTLAIVIAVGATLMV
ncbi:cytochrome C oxidase subunit IV family protein [Alkalimarinus sediminis]|uniref:Cytochrome C oxidase subunit IV family protein n=1 Tax=Alkalimarinus sediminis TaxID=1632866 RepID=A0A9E8HNC3_9ALTE|nr:cytochrome C oxidase subunit IV family protein [Alkalimarinus sediminis]UZW75753.1 cytochrome C oxidase subunit IV family protein [Alkalimarinus sediminis]